MTDLLAMADGFRSIEDMNTIEQREYYRFLQKKATEENLEAVKYMIALGLNWRQHLTPVEHNPMHKAVQKGNTELVKLLLRIKNLAQEPNCYGGTPLHLACRHNRKEIAQELLQFEVDINARDQEGNTPLYHAAFGRSKDCAKLLIEAGCDLDALNDVLMSPLDEVLVTRQPQIVSLLLRAGCRVEKAKGHVYDRDHLANSVFYTLMKNKDLDNMHFFLDCGYRISRTEVRAIRKTCHQDCSPELASYGLNILEQKPQKLTTLCQWTVRRKLMKRRSQSHTPMDAMIGRLPVPDVMKQFLMMSSPLSKLEPCKEDNEEVSVV